MTMCLITRRNAAVKPALGVDAVDAVHLNPAVFQMLAHRLIHLAVFPIEETSLGSGKYNDASPGVTPDDQFHVTVEVGAMPFVIFSIHLIIAFSCPV